MPADRTARRLALVLLVAALVRLPLLPARGWERDVHWFRVWAVTGAEHGVTGVADRVWCDYPPAYLYVLAGIGQVHAALSSAAPEESMLLRLLLKTPAVLCDLLGAWILFRLIRARLGDRAGLLGAALYALNPLVLYESAYWGQVDSVSALLLLASTALVLRGQSRRGAAAAGVALLTKLQVAVFLPVLLIVVYRRHGRRELLRSIGAGMAAMFVVCLPWFLAGRMESVTSVVTGAVGRYPFLSMNAMNLWWIVSGASGTTVTDLAGPLAGLSYRTLGLLLFAAFYAIVLLWYLRGRDGNGRTWLALAAIGFGFYMLPTQMHERYVFPVFALLVPFAVRSRAGVAGYVLLSVVSFLTLVVTLSLAWPENQPWLASRLGEVRVPLTLALAWANLLALGAAAVVFGWRGRPASAFVPAALVFLAFALPAVANRGPVYLSAMEPIEATQGWGELRMDRSVDGHPICIHGFRYRRGIGTHAPSSISFHLGGRFARFEADIGIQFEANRGDHEATFEVWTAARGVSPVRVYASGPLVGHLDPIHVVADVSGAETLWLVTGEGRDGKNSDHTVWAGARVVP